MNGLGLKVVDDRLKVSIRERQTSDRDPRVGSNAAIKDALLIECVYFRIEGSRFNGFEDGVVADVGSNVEEGGYDAGVCD